MEILAYAPVTPTLYTVYHAFTYLFVIWRMLYRTLLSCPVTVDVRWRDAGWHDAIWRAAPRARHHRPTLPQQTQPWSRVFGVQG